MSDLDGGAMARPACEHHWVFQLGPHIPPEIGSVGVCSLCGDVNGADLAEKLAEVERERDEARRQFEQAHDDRIREVQCRQHTAARADAAEARLAAVRELHVREDVYDAEPICNEDGFNYPCETIRALDAEQGDENSRQNSVAVPTRTAAAEARLIAVERACADVDNVREYGERGSTFQVGANHLRKRILAALAVPAGTAQPEQRRRAFFGAWECGCTVTEPEVGLIVEFCPEHGEKLLSDQHGRTKVELTHAGVSGYGRHRGTGPARLVVLAAQPDEEQP